MISGDGARILRSFVALNARERKLLAVVGLLFVLGLAAQWQRTRRAAPEELGDAELQTRLEEGAE